MAGAGRWTAALDRVLELVVVLSDDMTRGLAHADDPEALVTAAQARLAAYRADSPDPAVH
ncbi:hypothetical protein [Micromonospora sp. NPDC002717]|uniref:hypothetical protein n=1 Tax=Micromonospora sp. NPDC002717 TaxID=3154424 RepID=UPI0033247F05